MINIVRPPLVGAPLVIGVSDEHQVTQADKKCFGWANTVGGLGTSRLIGHRKRAFPFVLTFAACNLIWMRNLGVGSR
jgi:hypothetical protein